MGRTWGLLAGDDVYGDGGVGGRFGVPSIMCDHQDRIDCVVTRGGLVIEAMESESKVMVGIVTVGKVNVGIVVEGVVLAGETGPAGFRESAALALSL